jgi:hypothetical protein
LADKIGRILGHPIVGHNKIGGAAVINVNSMAKANLEGGTNGTVSSRARLLPFA